MMSRTPRTIAVDVRYTETGELEVVLDDLHHYYPGTELDQDYLEVVIEGSGYDYRQVRQALRDAERIHAGLELPGDPAPEPDPAPASSRRGRK